MKVVLTGIAGKMGRIVAMRLCERGHRVIGLDRRSWPSAPDHIELHRYDIRKRAAEDVFRTERPDAAVHMATVTHLTARSEDRYRINLEGTRAFFDYCHEYSVPCALFIGRHTYYGAGPEAPLYHREDDPPSSINVFPELSDLVAADLYAGSTLWRHPEISTAILRVCYTLGPSSHGTLSSYLRGKRVPTVLGFDPLFQFMHESDVAQAICLALEHRLRGVYNIAGPQPVPLSILIREAGRIRVPVPESLFSVFLGRLGLPRLPRGALAHIKYPIIMDTSAFRQATGFEPEFDESDTLRVYREAIPPPV